MSLLDTREAIQLELELQLLCQMGNMMKIMQEDTQMEPSYINKNSEYENTKSIFLLGFDCGLIRSISTPLVSLGYLNLKECSID